MLPSITWLLLMKSGNSLNSGRFFSSHTFGTNAERKIPLQKQRGYFQIQSYFGFHYSEILPQGPRSYLYTKLDGFSLLCSVCTASQHMPRTAACHLRKPCIAPASCVGHPCAEHVWRSGGQFSLDLPLVSVICFVSPGSQCQSSAEWTAPLSPQKSLLSKYQKSNLSYEHRIANTCGANQPVSTEMSKYKITTNLVIDLIAFSPFTTHLRSTQQNERSLLTEALGIGQLNNWKQTD